MVVENSLKSLNKSMNNNLLIKRGNSTEVLERLIQDYEISEVCWNARYSKEEILQDSIVEKSIIKHGLRVITNI